MVRFKVIPELLKGTYMDLERVNQVKASRGMVEA